MRITGDGDRNYSDPDTALWQAVVRQAFIDSIEGFLGARWPTKAQRDRMAARRWLLGNSDDFVDVCHAAGLDPDAVREEAKRRRDAGWPATDHPEKQYGDRIRRLGDVEA